MSRSMLLIGDGSAQEVDHPQDLAGHALKSCPDPNAGVAAALSGKYELILLRQSAPTAIALEILRQIKTAKVSAPVVVLTRQPTVPDAVAAMREGAADFLREPCSADEWQTVAQRLEQITVVSQAERHAKAESAALPAFEGMLGGCPAMCDVFALIQRIAAASATVLVTGESGTGKELVARAIHRHSRRKDRPLLACDCTALAPTLLESELFGHVKGSFSGAVATKKGLFEIADQGTLLLDEVANLSMETQAKLLRVLETRRVRKVGDTAELPMDIRLIATANRNLTEMVKAGQFRADLYYRLNVVPVAMPPLRDRGADVLLLADAFLDRFSRHMGLEVKGFSREAMRQMQVYAWPGNVRELRNIVERLAVLYGGSRIEVEHLPQEIREAKTSVSTGEVPHSWEELKQLKRQTVEDLERRFLIAALDRSAQNVTQAAESVGMQRTNFHALLRTYGLKPDTSRSPDHP